MNNCFLATGAYERKYLPSLSISKSSSD
uniref:Uncharacterized protein n=1 Tax=Rhizophora mucronata TaxID=61149 RepID=A0A2P2NPT6_RHIMU